MTLTNYWWLLIWLAVAGGACALFFQKEKIMVLGMQEYRWGWLPVLITSAPYVIWAMNRSDIGDTEAYRASFINEESSLSSIPTAISEATKDKGFTVLSVVLKSIIGNNDKIFFLIIAVIQLFCVVYFFRKYSSDFLLSMFLFMASADYVSWVFNGMRQFLAVCIILIAFDLSLRRKYILAVVLILLASTIHGSAIIMLPILFVVQGKAWNSRTVLLALAFIVAILCIDSFTSLLETVLAETQYSGTVGDELWSNDDGANMLRALFYSVPAAMSLVGKPYIDRENDRVIHLCVNASVVTSLLYFLAVVSSGIYIGRLPIYTTLPGYVAVPWMIDHMFTKKSASFVKFSFVAVYLVFFYYQMHVTWAIV